MEVCDKTTNRAFTLLTGVCKTPTTRNVVRNAFIIKILHQRLFAEYNKQDGNLRLTRNRSRALEKSGCRLDPNRLPYSAIAIGVAGEDEDLEVGGLGVEDAF